MASQIDKSDIGHTCVRITIEENYSNKLSRSSKNAVKEKKEEKKKKVHFKAFFLKLKCKTVESNGNCKTFLRY